MYIYMSYRNHVYWLPEVCNLISVNVQKVVFIANFSKLEIVVIILKLAHYHNEVTLPLPNLTLNLKGYLLCLYLSTYLFVNRSIYLSVRMYVYILYILHVTLCTVFHCYWLLLSFRRNVPTIHFTRDKHEM